MVFSSVVFVFVFLPVALAIHTLLVWYSLYRKKNVIFAPGAEPKSTFAACNTFLLMASLFFYAWGEPYHVIVMIISASVNYTFGLALNTAERHDGRRKLIVTLSVLFNLGLLGYYKYMNMFVDSGGIALINTFLPSSWHIPNVAKVALPLGVSFYTFQGMSYVLDVYRGDVRATLNLVTFSCYLTMFPQLVAGPIVRYSTIEEELKDREVSPERFVGGAFRFIVGLAKKLLIADTLARVADASFSVPTGQLSPLAAWAGVIAYAFQIYYDFSGYSDMAIGMGHMLGFTFLENFNYPYIARSVKDYWRRWHISLSTWFRDYLYISLGGNRRGMIRTSVNSLIVFALCGLWHGASWIFLVWGLYHGFFLALERIFPNFTKKMPRLLQHTYVILVFLMGWVLFRSDNFIHAGVYYKSLLGFYEAGVQTNLVWLRLFKLDVYLAFLFGAIGAAPIIPWMKQRFDAFTSRAPLPVSLACQTCVALLMLALLIVCFMPLFGATFTPFIYFRF
ncbi:MAG: hypothetical protein LBL05_01695 [Synergistaceae bacterium]|jgi:alginate O-acetyltransferase complex protein AlgI|nr:hypothetical protein [Synergistaceae bacterium]